MKMKLLLFMPFVFMILSSCSPSVNNSVEQKPLEAYKETEADQEETQEEISDNPYQYLEPYLLQNEDISMTVYLPGKEEEGKEQVEKGMSGITVSNAFVSAETDIDKSVTEEIKKIKDMGNTESILEEKQEMTQDRQLAAIQYVINKEDAELYPCVRIVKIMKLTDKYALLTCIDVNNMLADDQSEQILKEVAQAYGIQIQEVN